MRNIKENVISFGLTAIIAPFYFTGLFLKWIISQVFDLISMIFISFKSQLAKFAGAIVLVLFVSWLF